MTRYGCNGRFLVPLDSPQARRYFRDALYVPPGIRGRLERAMHLPQLKHTESLTGTELLEELLEETSPRPIPRGAPTIYLRDYDSQDQRARAIAFYFAGSRDTPSAVAKSQSPHAESASLRIEAQALEQMQAFLPQSLRTTLPAVLQLHISSRGELLVTSGLAGRSAYIDLCASLTPWRHVDSHFDAAARWLAAFHDATRSSASDVVGGVTVAKTASHGDFWARNVLLDERGGIGVVDWEHFSPAASPFLDLFHYPLTYGLSYPWRGYRQIDLTQTEIAFTKTFIENNRVSRAVQRYFVEYTNRMALPFAVLRPALQLFLETRGKVHPELPDRPGTTERLPWEKLLQVWQERGSEATALLTS